MSRPLDAAPEVAADLVVEVDGHPVPARAGESVADLLTAAGRTGIAAGRHGRVLGTWCGTGVCFSCVLLVDGATARACLTPVARGMVVTTRAGLDAVLVPAPRRSALA